MSLRGEELVATDKPTVVSKPFLDATVVEGGQSNSCFSDPPCADEGNWSKMFSEVDHLLNQLVASKACPWRWGR